MLIQTHCYNCRKSWKQEIDVSTHLKVVAFDFCQGCKLKMTREFEAQFGAKLILPRLRTEGGKP